MMESAAAEAADVVNDGGGRATPRVMQSLVCALITFIIAFGVVFFRTPWPGTTIGDSDAGHQLAGGQQIASGEHPFINFRSTYGPLTFYVSFVGQWLSGGRLAGELLICTFAFAFTYAMLLVMSRWMTGGRRIVPIAITILALIQLPRFYKYYILLGPTLALFTLLWYLAKPTFARRLLAAFGVVVAGLYRPDMGAYSALAGMVAMALVHRDWDSRVRDMFRFGVLIVLVASPWLIFVSARHHLLDYLHDSVMGSASQAQGLSLPFPRPHANLAWNAPANLEAFAFYIWWSLPLIGAIITMMRWRAMDELLRRRAAVTILLAAMCLLQSAHRSEYNHLIPALAPSYVLAAFIVAQLLDVTRRMPVRIAIASLAVVLAGVSVAAGKATGSLAGGAVKAISSYRNFYMHDRQTFVARVGETYPKNPYPKLIRYIDTHTSPGDRILAVPFIPMLYYLSDRPFAGGQMLIAPGYFSAPADEYRMTRQLKAQGNPMIIESVEGGAFDGMASREIRSFSPVFYAYLLEAYEPVNDPALPEGYRVWRAKGGRR